MQYIYNLITLDVQNEYDLEHDLEYKPLLSESKIYDADGNLSKHWHICFLFVDSKTGKLKRIKNICDKTNQFKIKESRYYVLKLYRRKLLKLL
jgi:hypothetical protein